MAIPQAARSGDKTRLTGRLTIEAGDPAIDFDPVQIREIQPDDMDSVWQILEPTIRAGETYALPRDMTRGAALDYWTGSDRHCFVATDGGRIAGTYYLRANQLGGGAHVCNCGYMTAPESRGRGVGRAMFDHSVRQARARGFAAMQFNFVVSTNAAAVTLWQSLGFSIVGVLPAAFEHPTHGRVDAFVMFRAL